MTIPQGILFDTVTGGVLYEIASGGVLWDDSRVYAITRDDYFTRNQPAKSEELKNRVLVRFSPLIEGDPAEVYRSPEPVALAAAASVIIEAEYNTLPCIDAVADVDEVIGSTFSITAVYYSWGAVVTVTNTGGAPGTCEVFITGTPLTVDGEDSESSEDAASIAENGVLEYKFPDNYLIQTRDIAALIAPALIASYATPRKDTVLVWIGDPALELGDEIKVPTYERNTTRESANFYIFKNKVDFDGTLRQTTEGRLIS